MPIPLTRPEIFELPVDPRHQIMIQANKTFIGTMQSPAIEAMGCLLEDGTFLTCLHAIFDFQKLLEQRQLAANCYYDLTKMQVYFVKDNMIFPYTINHIIHDGLTRYFQNAPHAMSFDYALLRLNGNPLADLEGGLQLDTKLHGQSAFSTDPSETLAISGPIFTRDGNNIYSRREISISKNSAAAGSYYMFAQSGTHSTAPGLSGLAIFPIAGYPVPNNTLYSIHSKRYRYFSAGQEGIKISEYRLSVRMYNTSPQMVFPAAIPIAPMPAIRSGLALEDMMAAQLNMFEYEGKTKKQKEAEAAAAVAAQAAEALRFRPVINGVQFYLGVDGHGKVKHTEFKNLIDKARLKNWCGLAATFNNATADIYTELVERAITQWACHFTSGDCPYHRNLHAKVFIDCERIIGWDAILRTNEGAETSIIELYYNQDVGSHIRPKHPPAGICIIKLS